jgi:hypothetical protein
VSCRCIACRWQRLLAACAGDVEQAHAVERLLDNPLATATAVRRGLAAHPDHQGTAA